jgi:hypothetical protein
MERPERETGVEEVSRTINGSDRGRVQSGWGVLREQKKAAAFVVPEVVDVDGDAH